MKKRTLALLLVWATLLVAATHPQGEARRQMALRAQSLRNLTPGRENTANEIRRIADSLAAGGRDVFYFSTLNVLSDQLFSEGRFSEADKVTQEMDREAAEANDRLARAISRRMRGQMYFKLSQPGRALHELDTALIISPAHELDLNSFSTHASINEWRVIAALQLKDTVKAIGAMRSYRAAVDHWRSAGWQDSTRHFEVTARAYEADEKLWHGDRNGAARLLEKAAADILPSLPARAYEHFYYARTRLSMENGDYESALRDIDTLLLAHKDFPWFYIPDLRMKARILSLSGRHSASRELYERAAEMRDSLSAVQISRQLADLTSLYDSEIDHQHHIVSRTRIIGIACVAALLFILAVFLSVSYCRQRRRNHILVEKLQDYDRRVASAPAETASPQDKATVPADDSELMVKITRFIRKDKAYSDPSFGRMQLATAMKVSVDTVARAIRECRDMTVHNFINSIRLDEARHLLEESEMSLAEIATAVGFGTTRTFQRIFKDNYSMSPSQYRDISRKS